jgi:hypothetical protein
MKRLDTKESKPHKGKHQRINMIQGNVNDDGQHMDNNEEIDDPKEIEACSTACGKHHDHGRCSWHENKKDEQGEKCCPAESASKPAQEKKYTMGEIKELTQLFFAMFGRMDASANKSSNKKQHKTSNNEQEVKLNYMPMKMHSDYHGNNNDTSDSKDDD